MFSVRKIFKENIRKENKEKVIKRIKNKRKEKFKINKNWIFFNYPLKGFKVSNMLLRGFQLETPIPHIV